MDARLIAIGDIHGCHAEFAELLERVAPGRSDQLILLGDLINHLIIRQRRPKKTDISLVHQRQRRQQNNNTNTIKMKSRSPFIHHHY